MSAFAKTNIASYSTLERRLLGVRVLKPFQEEQPFVLIIDCLSHRLQLSLTKRIPAAFSGVTLSVFLESKPSMENSLPFAASPAATSPFPLGALLLCPSCVVFSCRVLSCFPDSLPPQARRPSAI